MRHSVLHLVTVCALVGGLRAADVGAAEARTRPRSPARATTRYTGQVNLNEATLAQLELLPSVGEKAAQRILERRKQRAFTRVEELARVKGVGRKRFLKLKPYLTLQGETTLRSERVPPAPGPG